MNIIECIKTGIICGAILLGTTVGVLGLIYSFAAIADLHLPKWARLVIAAALFFFVSAVIGTFVCALDAYPAKG
jgi:hypothetical protein